MRPHARDRRVRADWRGQADRQAAGIAKHSADSHLPAAMHQRQNRTPQKMDRDSKRSGADVCGRLMLLHGPNTAAARTRKGCARIGADVYPAMTKVQRFKKKR